MDKIPKTDEKKCPFCEAEAKRRGFWDWVDVKIWHDNGHVWPRFAGEPDSGNYGGSDFLGENMNEFAYFDEYPHEDPFVNYDELQFRDETATALIELMHEYLSFATTKDLIKLIGMNL